MPPSSIPATRRRCWRISTARSSRSRRSSPPTTTAITSAATRRCSRASRCPCSARRARRSRAARTRSREGDVITVPGFRWCSGCWTSRATRRGTSRTWATTRRARRVRRRHAVRGRLRPAVRGHGRADGRLARQARGASRGNTRVLRPRVHAVEPALRARGRTGQRRLARAAVPRAGQARSGAADGPFVHCRGARDQPVPARRRAAVSPRRRRTRAGRSPTPSTRLPSCASGRTDFADRRRVDARARGAYHRRSFPGPRRIELRSSFPALALALAALLAACATPAPPPAAPLPEVGAAPAAPPEPAVARSPSSPPVAPDAVAAPPGRSSSRCRRRPRICGRASAAASRCPISTIRWSPNGSSGIRRARTTSRA